MSRGWESKNVEEQQNAAQVATPAQKHKQDAERQRKLQSLQMQRERILSERTSSPHRRTALEAALLEVEERLAELGWSIHL